MIHFTSGQLTGWMMLFFWPFVRILAFVSVAPIFGETSVPRTVKIGIAGMLALVIAPVLPAIPNVSPLSYAGIWLLIQQILIGTAIGFVMQIVFAAVQASGDYIGLQMGLGFASFYSAAMGTNSMVLSQLLNTFALLFFLAFNGHLVLIHILADTFTALPIGAGGLAPDGWIGAARWGTTVFIAGVSLALPLIAALLTINLAMGILNRASPQLSIFSIGFPMTLLAGLAVFTFITPELGGVFRHMFINGFEQMNTLIQGLAAPKQG